MEIFNIKVGESGQILHDLTYIQNLKSQTQKCREWNSGCQGIGDGRHGEMLVKGYQLSVMQDEKVLKI